MKTYLIRECNSYKKDEVVAVATSKKQALEWLKCLDLSEHGRNRMTNEFSYDVKVLFNKKNVTTFKYFPNKSSDYYVVDEWNTI